MSATISVVCYKSKVLKNNESPLMIRICKDGKRKYESLGISLLPKYWDFNANKPTSKCPNKEYIEKVIAEKTKAYTDKILELKAMEKEFTATTLIRGKVRVENMENQIVLSPGQQAIRVNGCDEIQVKEVDVNHVVAWHRGYFFFEES